MSGARVNRKKPLRALLSEKASFPEFLLIWNSMERQQTPAFHLDIAQWLESTDGKPTRLLMAFRDAAKSWLISCFCAWKLHCDPNETFILISAVQDLATKNATFIRDIIERHPLTKHLVPQGETELWRRQSFTVTRDKNPGIPTVQALTLFGDWTGKHSRYLFADDIETLANAETPESRASVRNRIKQFRSMSQRIMWIGTPHWGKQTLYSPLLADPDNCDSRQYPAYIDGPDAENPEEGRSYTWPDRLEVSDPQALALKQRELGAAEFGSQYLLEPVDMTSGGLELEFVHAYSDELLRDTKSQWYSSEERISATIGDNAIVDLVAAWDPAPGKGDDSVLAIVARSNTDRTFIHRCDALPAIDAKGWQNQTDTVIATMKRFGVVKVVVETNTNPALPAELRMAAERAKYQVRVIGVHNTIKKEQRVRLALEAAISNGRLHAHVSVLESKFAEQARDFPACMKGKAANDFIDAAAFGVLHLRKLPAGVIVQGILSDYSNARGRLAIRAGSGHGDAFERLRAGRRSV